MYLELTKTLAFLARKFPGIRKTLSNFLVTNNTEGCTFEDISFPFDKSLMDKKRLIAIASGSIEYEEIYIAKKYFNKNDTILELGSGLGISSSLIFKKVFPKKMICLEANPAAMKYAKNLFKINNLKIHIKNTALGNGREKSFYVCNDYLLSSFKKPTIKQIFTKIKIKTTSIDTLIKNYKPNALFCDIEGAEKYFLNPSKLFNIKKVVIELHPDIYGEKTLQKIIVSFKNENYKLVEKTKQTYCFIKNKFF